MINASQLNNLQMATDIKNRENLLSNLTTSIISMADSYGVWKANIAYTLVN